MSEKENYYKSIEGDTVIESWTVDGGRTRQDVYKLKVTIGGVPQRLRTYTNEQTFLSLRMSFFVQAQKRTRGTL